MIISRAEAKKAVRDGRAEETGLTRSCNNRPDGVWYVIVDRYDKQRVDHYPATDAEVDRFIK